MEQVRIWEQTVTIPTYRTGDPDKNPMFLEKRVYQGSSGRVYPHSVIDKIYDEREDRAYRAVFLENKYLKIMVLPELGGRIQRATDKTNGYDFVYYNHVIKPALVGLAGPWISGGIEFNWPQHHRPSTFDPVDYTLRQNPDGSATLFVGEIENMFRTKGMAGFTLRPDRAYLEIHVRLYNRTNTPQTFLWWANPAVAVNEHTRSIFPPDVHAVMDHGKRDVSNFPIATGTYYKMDYSAGVDISRYKNIPVPTSYMAYKSDYDFVGGYDYGQQAGILHVADHHISPGKKQWTWGCGEFGQAWDRNLTDEDGPYIELMTGCFTDNQPDFSWLMPYEEKTFTQYFMPYKGVGNVLNATKELMAGMEVPAAGVVQAGVYASRALPNVCIEVRDRKDALLCRETVDLSPEAAWVRRLKTSPDAREWDFVITVTDETGKTLLTAQRPAPRAEEMPAPARAMPLPAQVKTTEDLYLCGVHLEQYRHATYEPADYYLEGLRRDPDNARLHTAYGKLLFGRGRFAQARPHFARAVEKLTRSNPNPYDGEPVYYLALTDTYLGDLEKAYDGFYKATWNAAWQAAGFYHLACLSCRKGDYAQALAHIEQGLIYNWHNMKARDLKAALLRRLGREAEARQWIGETLGIDPLDHNSRNELLFLGDQTQRAELDALLHRDHNTYIELAGDYMEAGLWEEASAVLEQYLSLVDDAQAYPLVLYYAAYVRLCAGDRAAAGSLAQRGQRAPADGCFPHRLDDIRVLEAVQQLLPEGDKAYYYLGCLWYDKKQYALAVENWQQAEKLQTAFPTVHRNLALAYYNKTGEKDRALEEMEKAFALDPQDARVLMELDQLHKKLGWPAEKRLAVLEAWPEVTASRDDLYLEYLTLLGDTGRFAEEREKIMARRFHPWEGGEGKVPAQYLRCHLALAREAMAAGRFGEAEELLTRLTGPYPRNLGEGRLANARENDIYYYLGEVYAQTGRQEMARQAWQRAAAGELEPAGMMYYNDQPPEMIYYQGLALERLGEREKAASKFNRLIDYGMSHLFEEVKIDYFAVSLPDLQIFDEDLNRKNKIHCYFLMALGYMGKGEKDMTARAYAGLKELDPNHTGGGIL